MQCGTKPTFPVTAPPTAFEVTHCGGRHSQLLEQVKFFLLRCSNREYETRWAKQKFSSRVLPHLWDWSQAGVVPCCACTVFSDSYVQQRTHASNLSGAVNQKLQPDKSFTSICVYFYLISFTSLRPSSFDFFSCVLFFLCSSLAFCLGRVLDVCLPLRPSLSLSFFFLLPNKFFCTEGLKYFAF